MTIAAADLAARREVWALLSDLYLDTDTSASMPAIARALADSSYSMRELRAILFDEIHPVLRANLTVAAGVWDAFDQGWLGEQILRRMARPVWLRSPRWFLSGMAKTIWLDLAPLIERCRIESTLPDTGRSLR